jgi:hypothetical protein
MFRVALVMLAVVLVLGLVLGLGPASAWAFGDADKLAFAQVQYAGNWNPRPSGAKRLAWEIEKRTSIEAMAEPVAVRLSDEAALRRQPLLYLAGDGAFTPPEEDVTRLRRHLQSGGFLIVDAADARPGGGFDQSVRALAKRLFPKEPLERLPPDHVIFKSFYLLRAPVGRVATVPYLEGVVHDGRVVLVYSQNDMGGAWARDDFGSWEHEVYPGGNAQREMAFRLGINLAMYALCLDYKTDQVHVPFILRRRQWQAK